MRMRRYGLELTSKVVLGFVVQFATDFLVNYAECSVFLSMFSIYWVIVSVFRFRCVANGHG